METTTTTSLTNEPTQELLSWHQPEIKRLYVSLDTASDVGSGIDGNNSTRTIR